MFKIGEINSLKVKRQTDIGYMLTDDVDDVLLHFNQSTRELNVDEVIDVFIYFDNKKRVTATMDVPFIKLGEVAFLEVVNVVEGLGIFVNINIPKDILISADDLPEYEKWPIVGDKVLCKLKSTSTQLIAKLVSSEEVKLILKPLRKLERFERVDATVIKSGFEGINLLSDDNHSIFVYKKHLRKGYRIGERVNVTINNIRDNSYNGTLVEYKLTAVKNDADIILDYLDDYDGFMPFDAKSSVEDIEEAFHMSKAAFKRALGNLYKKRLIEFTDNGTKKISR